MRRGHAPCLRSCPVSSCSTHWSDTPFSDDVVFSLAAAPQALWVGTLGGLYTHGGGTRRVDPADARAIVVGEDGVEVASFGEGVLRMNGAGSRLSVDHQAGTRIRALHHGGDRRCIGTDDGLWLGEDERMRQHLTAGIASRDVSAMAWDAATAQMWVGTFDAGLSVGRHNSWEPVAPDDVDPQINAIALRRADDQTVAWIRTARGLYRVAGEDVERWSKKDGLPDHHVQSVHVREDGSVLVGTTRGLVAVVNEDVVPEVHGKRLRRWAVWAIAEDEDGTLWLGTTQGLVRVPKEGAWERFSMLGGVLPDNWVTAIVPDGSALWVGTYAKGVVRLTRDGEGVHDPSAAVASTQAASPWTARASMQPPWAACRR